MATVTFTTRTSLVAGTAENIADVTDCLDKLLTGVNSIDKEQLSTANAQLLGMNNGTNVGRGKSIIATTESRTNAAYGLMPTPDRVQNVVLPTDGLIMVGYQATWQEAVAGNSRAAIFIGANQLKVVDPSQTAPAVQEASNSAAGGLDHPLFTASLQGGLLTQYTGTSAAYTGDVTTGQALGGYNSGAGPITIFAAAGTYDISVQFKSPSSGVTVKNRKLWVWTLGF